VIRREANRDESLPTAIGDKYFAEALEFCAARNRHPSKPDPDSRKENSRWGAGYGQEGRIVLRNATLFDGERFIDSPVDVAFSKGLIESVKKADEHSTVSDAVEYNMHGRYVTPGLVDMHSHHLAIPWPIFQMTGDAAEVSPQTLAVTSMVRIIDGLKAYDLAAKIIASGGVTSSLIIPGSSNLIGGEGTVVKNALYSGPNAEPVVEDMLLERGLPQEERRRYMKMALGENPKGTWGYSRLGNAWHLREHLQKGREIMIKQDDYCASVEATGPLSSDAKAKFIAAKGKFPFDLEMESIVSLLRGQVLLQNHNYEPEDLETMLRISKEFGYKVAGFHHATEAWQVPGMLKDQEPNITIATFAEFSLYKHESYSPSLYAGHILDKSGVKVAYKSDHVASFTNAKYLLSQAAVAHAFHLSSDKALQAVTSVPAAAIDQDHRVGYCRVGYDADVVVWDDHPLSRGATPLQVFIDGISQLNETAVCRNHGNFMD
jgi:imidazolonepropionase-like amidohydrolase